MESGNAAETPPYSRKYKTRQTAVGYSHSLLAFNPCNREKKVLGTPHCFIMVSVVQTQMMIPHIINI